MILMIFLCLQAQGFIFHAIFSLFKYNFNNEKIPFPAAHTCSTFVALLLQGRPFTSTRQLRPLEITTQGLKTFCCKIDGVEWVPCVDLYGAVVALRPIECRVNESDNTYAVSLGATRSVEDSIYSTTKTDASMYFWLNPCKLGLQKIPNSFLYHNIINVD
jgi:hypothetical protein